MILATFLVGVVIGFIPPILLGTRHARELHAENEALRRALRHVRGIAIQHPELRLRRYLEQVLDEDAGS